MRAAATLLLLATLSTAQQRARPMLDASGDRLERFSVRLDLSGVDRSSPSKLATSFLRLTADEQAVAARLLGLWRRAHLALLAKFYSAALVDRQRAAYAAAQPASPGWRTGEVQLRAGRPEASVWIESQKRRALLVMERREGSWWLREILDDRPGKGLVHRELGVPRPESGPPPAGALRATDCSTPLETVRSLQREMAALGAHRAAARRMMNAQFWPIVEAFYGAEFARKARRGQPPAPANHTRAFELVPAGDRADRIEVLVTEEAPDSGHKRSAVGHAAFDLAHGAGGWRIVGEWRKPAPTRPFEPVEHGFGLLFVLR